jgi:hypothetical protein
LGVLAAVLGHISRSHSWRLSLLTSGDFEMACVYILTNQTKPNKKEEALGVNAVSL